MFFWFCFFRVWVVLVSPFQEPQFNVVLFFCQFFLVWAFWHPDLFFDSFRVLETVNVDLGGASILDIHISYGVMGGLGILELGVGVSSELSRLLMQVDSHTINTLRPSSA